MGETEIEEEDRQKLRDRDEGRTMLILHASWTRVQQIAEILRQ